MADAASTITDPPRLTGSRFSMAHALAIVAIVLLAIATVGTYQWFFTANPLLGVWEATDEYGGQHFYEFMPGGKLRYWDIDRQSLDSPPTKRGPFHGTYYYEKDTIVAQQMGLLAPRVGTLHRKSKHELHQDTDGHIIRQNLTFTRVGND